MRSRVRGGVGSRVGGAVGSAGAARGRLVVCSGESRDQRSRQQAKAEKRTDRHLEEDVV